MRKKILNWYQRFWRDHPVPAGDRQTARYKLISKLHDKASVLELIGKIDEAEAMYRNNLEEAFRLDQPDLIANNQNNLAWLLKNKGDYEEAMHLAQSAEQLYRKLDNSRALGRVIRTMGLILSLKGDYEKSMEYCWRALQIQEEIDDEIGICETVNDMGLLFWYQSDYDSAMASFQEGLTHLTQLQFLRGIAFLTGNIGIIHSETGHYEDAITYYNRALELYEQIGDRPSLGIYLGNLGNVYKHIGDYDHAMHYYQHSLAIKEVVGDRIGISITLANKGSVHWALEQKEQALVCFDQAIKIGQEIEAKYYLCYFLYCKAEMLLESGETAQAREHNDAALAMALDINSPGDIFNSRILKAHILALTQPDQAIRSLEELLPGCHEDEQVARVHQTIWHILTDQRFPRMSQPPVDEETERHLALTLYEALYARSPNIDYRRSIEALTA